MTISPRRAKKKTVGVSGAGIVGLRFCSARGVPFTSGASPLARHVERTEADVVIGIGPVTALGLTRVKPEAIDLRGVAIVDADVPVGQDVGIDCRYASKVDRFRFNPGEPQGGYRPDAYYDISLGTLYVSRKF